MREIKFRAWDSLADVWIENIASQELWFIERPPTYIDIMQYSGLRDKQGVEIYEGDILESGNLHYKLVWEDGKACELHNKKDKYAPRFTFNYLDEIEVIGNIYENPELLEEK
jgi:hypothetical protein